MCFLKMTELKKWESLKSSISLAIKMFKKSKELCGNVTSIILKQYLELM